MNVFFFLVYPSTVRKYALRSANPPFCAGDRVNVFLFCSSVPQSRVNLFLRSATPPSLYWRGPMNCYFANWRRLATPLRFCSKRRFLGF